MTGAWTAIGLIGLGLPLLAWWIGGRRLWSRLRPGRESDPWGDTVRRHGLRPAEVARVRQAVTSGQELPDPRLRAAAVDWAEQELTVGRAPAPTWVRVLLAVWLTVVVVRIAFLLAEGRAGDVNWVAVIFAIGAAVYVRHRRKALHRAVRLNGGPPGDAACADAGQRE